MFAVKRVLKGLGIVLFLGCAPAASVADDQIAKVSESVSFLEFTALPQAIVSLDFWSASRVYFQLAIAHERLKETGAACAALSQSVGYYRAALVKDNLASVDFDDIASGGAESNDLKGMRAKFGCDGIQSASF
jgi:hypothetical protein